jgi:transcriptional regulator with XRE-family HTH domain
MKKDVAKALSVSESTVGRWESGESMPDDDAMLRLARFFGVTPAWLRYGAAPREAVVPSKPKMEDPHLRDREESSTPHPKRRGA